MNTGASLLSWSEVYMALQSGRLYIADKPIHDILSVAPHESQTTKRTIDLHLLCPRCVDVEIEALEPSLPLPL